LLTHLRAGQGYPIRRRGQWSDRRLLGKGHASRRTLRIVIWPEASNAQDSMVADSAQCSRVRCGYHTAYNYLL